MNGNGKASEESHSPLMATPNNRQQQQWSSFSIVDGSSLSINVTSTESKNQNQIPETDQALNLKPGDELMTREQIPTQHWLFYLTYYIFLIISLPICFYLPYSIYQRDNKSYDWLLRTYAVYTFNMTFITFFNWFNGALFRDYFGIRASYTRKFTHISIFTLPFLIDAIVNRNDFNATLSIIFGFMNSQVCNAL
jgi:hypothetical protein